MGIYIGIKVVQAVPAKMVNGCIWPQDLPLPEIRETVRVREEECCGNKPANRIVIEEGYCYDSGNGYPAYVQKEEFEKEFFPAENLTFSVALDALKRGQRIARKGWNGKNQYVELARCISYKNAAGDAVNVDHKNIGNRALAFVGTSGVQLGWLASQADLLAEDWYVVELSEDGGMFW